MSGDAERTQFDSKVVELLHMIEKIPKSGMDVFLWVFIRLAIGDLMRYRIASLTLKDNPDNDIGNELCIKIDSDVENKSLSITDTGVGMTKEDLIDYVNLEQDQVDIYKDVILKHLLPTSAGGCGVDLKAYYDLDGLCLGVFSAFMVAYRVVITTKHHKDENQYVLDSDGETYSIAIAPNPHADTLNYPLNRGTKVTLYLKDEHLQYLEIDKLKGLVGLHTFELCPYPIHVSAEGQRDSKRQRVALDFNKKEDCYQQEPWSQLEAEFKVLLDLCKLTLGSLVQDIVLDDCVFDLPTNMSADKKRFEINPRHPVMKSLLLDYQQGKEDDNSVQELFDLHYHMFLARLGDPYYYESDPDADFDFAGFLAANPDF